jgi:hypothetical protein
MKPMGCVEQIVDAQVRIYAVIPLLIYTCALLIIFKEPSIVLVNTILILRVNLHLALSLSGVVFRLSLSRSRNTRSSGPEEIIGAVMIDVVEEGMEPGKHISNGP